IHFLAFQQALAEDGLALTQEEYYGTYLGMDERTCAGSLLEATTGQRHPARVQRITERKAALFASLTETRRPPLFPGAVEFVTRASARYRLAIASGGRRQQIEFALHDTPIENAFAVLVSAEDAAIGKPDPAIYHLALARLNEASPRPIPAIQATECLVIEDSLAGIQSALAAKMKVVALATTYPPDQLAAAHLVFLSLGHVSLDSLESLFKEGDRTC
ncbi:MAG TPA: HAD family phosphatase, partial [Nitrospirales bacterium]|nr:HAD family phosphatase [Nitrospirales bacterium]